METEGLESGGAEGRDMAYLEILSGYNTGQCVALVDEIRVGRNPDNDLCLLDASVSRYHARVSHEGGRSFLTDLGSSNGTKLGGKRLATPVPHEISTGDLIEIGSTRLMFQASNAPSAATKSGARQAMALVGAKGPSETQSHQWYTRPLALCQLEDREPSIVVAKLDAALPLKNIDPTTAPTMESMQQATRRLQAMCQISAALSTITNLDMLLHKVVTCICDIFPESDRAFILLKAPKGDVLVPVAVKTRQGQIAENEAFALSRTLVDEVLKHKQAILSQDTDADSRFNAQESIISLSIRSVMCAPLLADDEVLGLVQVDAHGGPKDFNADDLHLLSSISAQAATAVKQAQLLKQLAETNIELRRENTRREQAETASHEAQEQAAKAESANAAKSEFLANMSHELRTPLHVILSCADFGLTRLETVPLSKLQRYFEQIAQNGETLLALVNDVLDLAKFEAGKMAYEFRSADLTKLLKQVESECHVLTASRQLMMVLNVPAEPVNMWVDTDKIRQVLRNLLSNAIKFSPDAGTITLVLRVEPDRAVIVVQDQGPGIPSDELETIFDKFVQSSLTKTGAGGTGLGLAICCEIVKAHDGHLWAENGPGGGALFGFSLPLVTSADDMGADQTD